MRRPRLGSGGVVVVLIDCELVLVSSLAADVAAAAGPAADCDVGVALVGQRAAAEVASDALAAAASAAAAASSSAAGVGPLRCSGSIGVGIGSRGGGCLGLSVSPRRRPARSNFSLRCRRRSRPLCRGRSRRPSRPCYICVASARQRQHRHRRRPAPTSPFGSITERKLLRNDFFS